MTQDLKCTYPGCKNEADIILRHLGAAYCEKHWNMHCAGGTQQKASKGTLNAYMGVDP